MERRINVVAVDDLRASANQSYTPDQPLPRGAFGLFGPDVPIGSVAYAAADARAISPKLTPPSESIPGWRVSGSLWPHERFIVRVPKQWNGRLIVAGTPAQRSEFANDLIWSNPLVARGYAYVCGNKSQGDGHVILTGDARLEVDGAVMPRFLTAEKVAVSFWQHSPGNGPERWMQEFFAITDVACELIEEVRHRAPEAIYAVGLSNGGGEVRFALERSDRYAGGLAWNAVLWSPRHNLLAQLPQAIAAMEQREPEKLLDLGFPPDVHGVAGGSLYEKNYTTYWNITSWLHAMLVDPDTSIAYGDVSGPEPAEAWNGRMGTWRIDRAPQIAQRIAAYPHTGAIRSKMIDLASAYDHLLPPRMHFYPYSEMVAAAGKSALYRSELIENAQHVDAWSEDANYPHLGPGHPRVLAAFDELVHWVEG
jgi:hypothetical protein